MTAKIIKFPGATKATPTSVDPPLSPLPDAAIVGGRLTDAATGEPLELTEDQRKAIGIILTGMPFVFVGIKPMESGTDFFTALHGDATDLRNAQDHLLDVIGRLYNRKGIS